MKLLFDENLSHALVGMIDEFFPGSAHVRDAGLARADDRIIWTYAMERGYAIVTKDEDFAERALLEAPPPKIVWVRLGNCTTEMVEELLRSYGQELLAFGGDAESALMVLP